MSNPFVYSEPVSPEALLDRDEETATLVERAVGSHNSRLVAPRRYGKTSLLRRVLEEVEDEGFTRCM
jgi:AAA+ ATPase superfamily predicted ATPase